ncbi:MAG TPA: hypothetical protein VGI42_05770 [Chthoniobacterales bacterium]|jgi:hypothetical protein
MLRWFSVAIGLAGFFAAAGLTRSQLADPNADAVRVAVSMNADGSRTIYEFDSLNHRATATTTSKEGKLIGKIRYSLDDAGRFASGEVYGPDERLRFKTLYKYEAGRLAQESQLGKDDALQHKIVYAYDANGKQTGYTVYDAAGKRLSQSGAPSPTASPRKKHSP